MKKRILVVCYSRTNNTAWIGKIIQKNLNADILRIAPVEEYPAGYRACVKQAKTEIETRYQPKLRNDTICLDEYDTIILGSPIWCGTFAPPMYSFICNHDFTGKTVVPFCTHGGGGQEHFTDVLKECLPQSVVKETLVLYNNGGFNAAQLVRDWIVRVGL